MPCRVRDAAVTGFAPTPSQRGLTELGDDAIGLSQGGVVPEGPHLRLQEQNWAAHGTVGSSRRREATVFVWGNCVWTISAVFATREAGARMAENMACRKYCCLR